MPLEYLYSSRDEEIFRECHHGESKEEKYPVTLSIEKRERYSNNHSIDSRKERIILNEGDEAHHDQERNALDQYSVRFPHIREA